MAKSFGSLAVPRLYCEIPISHNGNLIIRGIFFLTGIDNPKMIQAPMLFRCDNLSHVIEGISPSQSGKSAEIIIRGI